MQTNNVCKLFKNKFISICFVFVFALLLTTLFTWPFVLKIITYYSDFGDYPLGGSALWYNYQSIIEGKILNQGEYFKGYEFYPHPYTTAFSDHRIIMSLVFFPIYLITKAYVFSVNLTVFLSFVLVFISSFYSLKFFIKKNYPSLISAIIFTFNPFIFAKFPLHIDSLGRFFLFPLFVFAYKFFNKPSFKNSLYFYLFFTLNSLSMVYLEIFSIIILPLFFFPFLIHKLKNFNNFLFYSLNLLKYSLVAFIFIPVLLYFNIPYFSFSNKENITRPINGNIYFSARLIDYISPVKENVLYKGIFNIVEPLRSPRDPNNNQFNYEEHTLFLNILPILLLIFFFIFRKQFFKEKKTLYFAFLIIFISSFVFTFGPYFQGFKNFMNKDIKLPYYYLYNYFPFFNGIRVPTRFMFIFYVPFTLFVGYGSTVFLDKFKNNKLKFILFVFFILILFIENYNFKDYSSKSEITNKFSYTNTQKKLQFLEHKNTIHLPINIPNYGDDSMYSNWIVYTNEKMMNGNTGYLPPDITSFLMKIKNNLDTESIKELKALKINYIILHKNKLKNDKYNKNILIFALKKYEDEDILIIDLNKFNYDIKICNFEKDINKTIFLAAVKNSTLTFYAVTLENDNNCYLPSIYTDRYRKISHNSTDFYGNYVVKNVNLRMPILITPFEKVTLTEYSGEVRID